MNKQIALFLFVFALLRWGLFFKTGSSILLACLFAGLHLLLYPWEPEELRGLPTVDQFHVYRMLFWDRIPIPNVKKYREAKKRFDLLNGVVYKTFFLRHWVVNLEDAQMVREFFNSNSFEKAIFASTALPNSTEAPKYDTWGERAMGVNVFTAEGEVWKRQRRILSPPFKRIRSEPFVQVGNALLNQWAKLAQSKQGAVIDAYDWMGRVTLDAIGLAGFSFDFRSIEDSDSIYRSTFVELVGYVVPFLPANKRFDELLTRFDSLLNGVVEERRKRMEEGKAFADGEADLLELMLQAHDTDSYEGFNDREVRDNLFIFFFAGHETTANSLATALWYLARDKEMQEKARAEALSIMGDRKFPTLEDQSQMQYIGMIVKEALRIKPSAGDLPLRRCKQEFKFSNGLVIPPKVLVGVKIYDIHHNPKHWPDPESFIPERFTPENIRNRKPGTYLPFGGGQRLCIGAQFSEIEQRVLLAMILKNYDIEPAPEAGEELIYNIGIVLTPKNCLVRIIPRHDKDQTVN